MTIQSILQAESQVTDRVTLYREGMFWKAYERSAFLICRQIRSFKPTKKTIKNLGNAEVISIGFPDTSLENVIKGHPMISGTQLSQSYGGFFPLNEQDFQIWKNGGKGPSCPEVADHSPDQEEDAVPDVVSRLRAFDLLNHTPYECLLLVEELKRMLG